MVPRALAAAETLAKEGISAEVIDLRSLLPLDEVVERIEAVTHDDLVQLAQTLWAPERLSAAGIGPDEERFEDGFRKLAATVGTARSAVA